MSASKDFQPPGRTSRRNHEATRKRLRVAGMTIFIVLGLLALVLPSVEAQYLHWMRQFGSPLRDNRGYWPVDQAHNVAMDGTGNIYVFGETQGFMLGEVSSGMWDVFLRKYDPSGNVLWTRQFGTSGTESTGSMALDGTGNIYVAGQTSSQFPGYALVGYYDSFLRKYDASGNVLWTRQFDGGADDWARAVAVDGTGNVLVSGLSSCCYVGAGPVAGYIGKFDSQGNQIWLHPLVQTTDLAGDSVQIMGEVVNATGDFYLVGYADTPPSETTPNWRRRAFVQKYGASGNESWTRRFAGADGAYTDAQARGVTVDGSGNVFVVGGTSGILAGATGSFGGPDAFVRKYDPNGNELWTRQFGTIRGDLAQAVAIDQAGNIYVGGDTWGIDLVLSGGSVSVFDPDGNPLWTHEFGTADDDHVRAVAPDGAGNVYLAGYTQLWTKGDYEAFVAKIGLTPPPNSPPTVSSATAYYTNEGSPIVVTATGSDPDGDPLTYAWDLDNNGTFETPGQSVSYPAIDGPSSPTIVVKATDSRGLSATSSAIVYITGVPATLGTITAPLVPIVVNTDVNVSANFTDPGALDTHQASWFWGDGSFSLGVITEANGSGSVTGNHAYNTPGVYELIVRIADKDNDANEARYQYLVVYDPSAGFATGAGLIDSLAGAYTSDPSLAGKANFGFVSRYQQGASAPSGQTQYRLPVADLTFTSTAYEWLVISGAKAQFKGTGTINGRGDYGFLISAIDGQATGGGGVDKLRMKIWDRASNSVIYDNQMGASDNADPTTAIAGGNNVIQGSR